MTQVDLNSYIASIHIIQFGISKIPVSKYSSETLTSVYIVDHRLPVKITLQFTALDLGGSKHGIIISSCFKLFGIENGSNRIFFPIAW